MDYSQLRLQRDRLLADARKILDDADAGDRALTADEQARYDENVARVEEINNQLTGGPTSGPTYRPQPSNALPNDDVSTWNTSRSIATVSRTSGNNPVLAAFGGTRREAERNAHASGMWLAAQIYGNERAARWCGDNGLRVYGAASEGVNTLGGHLVPIELENSVIKLLDEYGVARRECRVRPMGSDRREIPKRQGGLEAFYVGEAQAGTESDNEWSLVGLTARKMMVLTRMSSELSEDAVIDMAADFAEEISYAFATKEDNSLFNGDGTSAYGGILGVREMLLLENRVGAVQAASNHDTFAEIDAADLNAVMGMLPAYAARNAKWYTSRKGYVLVFQRLIEAAGGVTATDLVAGPIRRGYMGHEIIETEAMPTSTGDLSAEIMIVFGDLRKGVELGDRRGVRVALSESAHWATDEIGIRGTMRHDVVFHDAGDSTKAGAVVGLLGN